MLNQDVYQNIMVDLKTLPEEKVVEVLDFINFLKLKTQKSQPDAFIFSQFKSLKDGWEAPGMEVYNEL